MKAKKASLFSQIFACIWIISWSAYTFIFDKNISVSDIIYTGATIAGIFTPVYFSIFLDKVKNAK